MRLALFIFIILQIQKSYSEKLLTYSYPGEPKDNTYLGKLVKLGCLKNPIEFKSGLLTPKEISFLNKYNPYQRQEIFETTSSSYTESSESSKPGSHVTTVRLGKCSAKITSTEIEHNPEKLQFKSASIQPLCKRKVGKSENTCEKWYKKAKEEFKQKLQLEDNSKRPIELQLHSSTEPISTSTFVGMKNKHCKRKNGIFKTLNLCGEILKNEKCFNSYRRSKASTARPGLQQAARPWRQHLLPVETVFIRCFFFLPTLICKIIWC